MSERKSVRVVSDGGGVEESVDSYDVEADGAILPAAGLEKGLSAADDSLLLGAVDGLLGGSVGI